MGKKDKCSVKSCENKRNKPDHLYKAPHVNQLKFHSFPCNAASREKWITAIRIGDRDFVPKSNDHICSNHFDETEPDIPTLLLKEGDNLPRRNLTRKYEPYKKQEYKKTGISTQTEATEAVAISTQTVQPSLLFEDICKECDVRFFTGFESRGVFEMVFEWLLPVASVMKYWRKDENFEQPKTNRGPQRKLSYEQEFLMVVMRLRLGLLVEDLGFRFHVSPGHISRVFNTWICLMSRELSWMIMWPTKRDVSEDCRHRL
ncbi:uncharacterized protein LOC141903167 [Tubulanus polymorphus]|uniref:uncharacterized protein LOC141903167 n=1 Tax=Tubulanus polymorphus TaxID=672921 RepID=UPI003DA4C19F